VARLAEQLAGVGVPEPRLSAQYLVGCCLQPRDPSRPVMPDSWEQQQLHLSPEQLTRLDSLTQCRLAHMPLQYIVGNWDFCGLTLLCRPPVFIPRPETEQLVELVLSHHPDPTASVLEVGPGTGAVSLALLSARPDWRATAVDRSTAALQLARENATRLGLQDRLELLPGRVGGEQELTGLEAQYDLVVSNPPYILTKDLLALPQQVALFEDLRALDGGKHGLDVVLAVVDVAGSVLGPGGLLLLECDPCHPVLLPPRLPKLSHPFSLESVEKDFAGKERFLVLRKL